MIKEIVEFYKNNNYYINKNKENITDEDINKIFKDWFVYYFF